MFKIRWWVNGVEQWVGFGGYRNPDDAFRKVNQLWHTRFEITETGNLRFEISGADGSLGVTERFSTEFTQNRSFGRHQEFGSKTTPTGLSRRWINLRPFERRRSGTG